MTLHLYFARRFFMSFLGVAVSVAVLLLMIELMDKLGDFPDPSFGDVLAVALLEMPWEIYDILPLFIILGAVALFLRLSRSSELVVLRAAGRSALRGLMGPVCVALLIGILGVAVGNPFVASTSKRVHDLKLLYEGANTASLAISSEGLWLRQGGPEGQTVIFAQSASSDLGTLYEPTFLDFGPDGTPQRRIKAGAAQLGDGEWRMHDVKIWDLTTEGNPEAEAQRRDALSIQSDLTQQRIIDGFGRPQYIPIWDLPEFIGELEASGFSARRYAIWFQSELSRPVFFAALVLMSAAFTIRHARGANMGLMVLMAVIIGFGLHYIRNFAQILGESGQIPVALAAWAPPVAALLFALGLILHLEDG
jgi:lipopolysaccharide export system permease protein